MQRATIFGTDGDGTISLLEKFDKDGDGKISMLEYAHARALARRVRAVCYARARARACACCACARVRVFWPHRRRVIMQAHPTRACTARLRCTDARTGSGRTSR